MKSTVNIFSAEGFSYSNVKSYNNGRPSYNEETIQKIIEIIYTSLQNQQDDSQSSQLIEIGAGTGKFTQSFWKYATNFDKTKYLAIEPSQGFLESLQDLQLGIQTYCGAANHIPVEDRTISAIMIAQAFHWMSNHETLMEAHRILKPGSPLILVWNSFDYSTPWLQELEVNVLSRFYTEDIPRFYNGKWIQCFQTTEAEQLFSSLSCWKGQSEIMVTEDQIVDRVLSVSVVSVQPQEEKDKIRDEVLKIVRSHDSVQRSGDKISLSLNHIVYWTLSK